jgi:type VI secretion system protein VasJ
MLGLGKRKKSLKNWQWDIAGKHPAAKDFFALGERSLMAEAFTAWIRRGAESVVSNSKELLVRSCSWRFWAKTPQTGILSCGVIRNSCDYVGRPFPLLVMGTGKLENWEENWELLPFACERVWCQMEQLASKKYESFESFQEDMNTLRPSHGSWNELNLERIDLVESNASVADLALRLGVLEEEQAMFVPFQDVAQYDFFATISDVHSQLKMKVNTVPNSFFMGGLIEYPGLAIFKRPLSKQDFERLWMPENQ